MDRQLKVRGFRVEPGEIESVLAGHPDIDQVSVVASTRSSGDTRLVAYYTPSAAATAKAGTGTHHPSAASFRSYLLDRLPGYMIPAAFIARHRLPTPPERDELAAHQDAAHQDAAHQAAPARPARAQTGPAQTEPAQTEPAQTEAAPSAPRQRVPKQRERLTPTQAGLAALWARLLHRERVGLDDDFFALGGNSLLAAEMLAGTRASFRIPSDSVRPLTRCLLRDPTLRGFAAAVRDARAGRLGADGDQQEIDFAAEAALDVRIRRDGVPSRPRPDWRTPARGPAHRRDRVPRRPPAAGTARRHRRAGLVPGQSARRGRRAAPHRAGGRALRAPGAARGPRGGPSRRPWQARARTVRQTVPRPRAHPRHHLPPGRAGELHLPVPGTAGRQRGGHPRGDPAGGGVPRHSGALRVDHRRAGRPRRRGRSRGHRGDAAPLPRAAADGLRRDEVRRRRATAERGPRGPSGRDLPAAGHRRQHRHRRLEHLDRDVRADQVHDRHRAGARHRPAA